MALLERDEQVRAVLGYLAEATSGHGRLVFVSGEPGVGKTSFVMAAAAQAEGARVAVGSCDGSATPAPLGPLIEMLPSLPDDVWPQEVARTEMFARLLATLRQPPQGMPYLLVIEDAHWADEATLDLIRHLARRVHGCRALVLVTYRSDDALPGHPLRVLLGDLATASGVRRLDLAPLTPHAVRALVEDHASRHPETAVTDADDLYRVTGGNAFYVTEALSVGESRVPATVRDAVLARTARLSPAARHAMDVVALVGSRAEVSVLDAVLADGLGALDEPLGHGLLRQAGGDIVYRHELARRAVAAEVPAFRRIAVHRQVLAALVARAEAGVPVDEARLAHHAEAAGDIAAVVAHTPAAAARAATLGAHREAVRQYRRVLRHAEHLPDLERADLLWALGYECYLTDDMDDAVEVVEAAQAIWRAADDDVRVGDAYRCLSRLNWFAGRNELAEEQARLSLDSLEGSESVELAMAYSNVTQMRMLASDTEGTRTWGARTLDLLDRLPEGARRTEVAVHVLNNLGTAEVTVGHVGLGVEQLVDSLDQARASDLHEHAARAYCNLASSAVVQRRYVDAWRMVEEGLEYCTDRDLDSWTMYLQGWKARLRLDEGDAHRAQALADDVLRHPTVAIGQIVPLVVAALARARSGLDGWAEPLAEGVRLAERTGEAQRLGPVTSARAEVAWLTGDGETGAKAAADAWPTVRDADCAWNRGLVATWLGRDEAERTVGSTELAPPYAAEVAGRWVEAAALWAQLGCPYDQAMALARSGEQEALAEAAGLFADLGADAAVSRTRALMRAAGWSAPRGPRTQTRRHPSGLTTREAEVLDLLAEGLSDAGIAERLVISRRTAEHHVAAILSKLGAGSRREAVEMGGRATGDG